MAKKVCVDDQVRGSAAESAIQKGISGIEMITSIRRWMTSSVVPPK